MKELCKSTIGWYGWYRRLGYTRLKAIWRSIRYTAKIKKIHMEVARIVDEYNSYRKDERY